MVGALLSKDVPLNFSEEKIRVLNEILAAGCRIYQYFLCRKENLELYDGSTPLAGALHMLRSLQRSTPPVHGRDFDCVRHYQFKTIVEGEGSFIHTTCHGKLFRGRICGDDGLYREVAVKKWEFIYPINWSHRFYIAKFYNELKLLTTQQFQQYKIFPNVIGYCCEDALAVVYDLQPEQIVQDAIPSEMFDWSRRMVLAIEISRLIESVHGRNKAIGSISSNNIIIDKDGNFKLFEIGKHIGDCEQETVTAESLSSYFYEGYGLYAPEIGLGEFSIKTDIYAFGILLLELISKQVCDQHDHDRLHRRASAAFNKRESFVNECFRVDKQVASRITSLALSCLYDDPARRQDIGNVVKELEQLYGHLC